MTEDRSAEETTIVATYTARRNAEMAQDLLEDEGIQAFITADDAGGMHPQLQRPHGVKLVVLGKAAPYAHEVLADARLLPQGQAEDVSDVAAPMDTAGADNLTFSIDRQFGVMGGVLVVLVIISLVFLATVWI